MTCFIVADFDMYHLVFGINFQIHFASLVCHLSIHLLIHLSTHLCHHRHCQHPSLLHFSIEAQNVPFQQILFQLQIV